MMEGERGRSMMTTLTKTVLDALNKHNLHVLCLCELGEHLIGLQRIKNWKGDGHKQILNELPATVDRLGPPFALATHLGLLSYVCLHRQADASELGDGVKCKFRHGHAGLRFGFPRGCKASPCSHGLVVMRVVVWARGDAREFAQPFFEEAQMGSLGAEKQKWWAT